MNYVFPSVAVPAQFELSSAGLEDASPSALATPAVKLDGRGLGIDDLVVISGIRCGETLSANALASVVKWLLDQGRGGFFSDGLALRSLNYSLLGEDGGSGDPLASVEVESSVNGSATAYYIRTKIVLPERRWSDLLDNEHILELKELLDAESANPHVRIQTKVGGGYKLNDQKARRWLTDDLLLLVVAICSIFLFLSFYFNNLVLSVMAVMQISLSFPIMWAAWNVTLSHT